jgi:hypothetical protein
MAISETIIVNMAFARIGSKRINDITTDKSIEAIQARTQYEQTRDALLRSFEWSFAKARATLSEDTATPDFDYDHQFILPDDYLRMVEVEENKHFSIEGKRVLTNKTTMQIEYIKRVIDPTEFDPLFVEVLVLHLALKFINPLAGTNMVNVLADIRGELRVLTARARVISRQEQNTSGRSDWNLARYGSGKIRP